MKKKGVVNFGDTEKTIDNPKRCRIDEFDSTTSLCSDDDGRTIDQKRRREEDKLGSSEKADIEVEQLITLVNKKRALQHRIIKTDDQDKEVILI